MNLQASHYAQIHLEAPKMPVDFIALNLVGLFDTTSEGNIYALKIICMLINHVFCTDTTYKNTYVLEYTYMKEICF